MASEAFRLVAENSLHSRTAEQDIGLSVQYQNAVAAVLDERSKSCFTGAQALFAAYTLLFPFLVLFGFSQGTLDGGDQSRQVVFQQIVACTLLKRFHRRLFA